MTDPTHGPADTSRPDGGDGAAPHERTEIIHTEPARPDVQPRGPEPGARYAMPGQPAPQQPMQGGVAPSGAAPSGSGQYDNRQYPYGPGPSDAGGNGLGTYPSTPYAAVPAEQPRQGVSKGAVVGAAALAALLASGLTFGLTGGSNNDNAVSPGGTTVVKVDGKEIADAQTNWASTASKVSPSVVSIAVSGDSGAGQGSGVILDKQGNIVTNNHVVSGAGDGAQVRVTLNNNRTYKASVVGKDPSSDLAVIRIKDVPDLTPIELGDDSKLVVGQPVMAVGNPLGLAGTATTGIVSALNRPVTTSETGTSSSSSETVVTNAIQTSAAINPGNSGGALVSTTGQLIGINSSIASLSSGATAGGQSGNIGIGFAIPVSVVKNITDQLIKDGKAQHALLGIATTTSEVASGSATVTAASVKSVVKGGSADKAGLREGDEIIAIDNTAITSSDALVAQVRARKVGSTIKLAYVRDGKRHETQVTLGAK